MLVYRGEKRFLAVELAAVIAEEDALTGTPDVAIVAKRGRADTELLASSPSGPGLSGTQVTFWVDVPEDQERGNYLVVVSCGTTGGETVTEEAPLIVQ